MWNFNSTSSIVSIPFVSRSFEKIVISSIDFLPSYTVVEKNGLIINPFMDISSTDIPTFFPDVFSQYNKIAVHQKEFSSTVFPTILTPFSLYNSIPASSGVVSILAKEDVCTSAYACLNSNTTIFNSQWTFGRHLVDISSFAPNCLHQIHYNPIIPYELKTVSKH